MKAITYFKIDSTYHMSDRLIPVMNLLKKQKVAFDIVYADFVGTVIYEDE